MIGNLLVKKSHFKSKERPPILDVDWDEKPERVRVPETRSQPVNLKGTDSVDMTHGRINISVLFPSLIKYIVPYKV